MAKILIIGCGAIGYELALALVEAGHEVTGLKRKIPEQADPRIRFYCADITLAADLEDLDTDVDQVFFIVSADKRDEQAYRAIYETGINNVLDRFAISKSKVPWIFVSSTSVYGQIQGEWVDEDSPTLPENKASLRIAQAEQKLMALDARNMVVRFSGIYGPGREHLLRMAMQGPAIQQHPPYYTNRIHKQDCVGILAFLLACRLQGVPLGQCYLASDDDPAPLWDVVSWIADAAHCPPPNATTAASDATMNKRCRNDKIKRLGYRFIYPDYRSGYAGLIVPQASRS
jgi:nucleoside-diphosphate-sugar epimerase